MNDARRHRDAGQDQPRRPVSVLLRQYWGHARGSRWLLLVILAGMLLDGVLQAGVVNYLKVLVDRLAADPGRFVREDLGGLVLLGLGASVLFFPVAYAGHLACSVLASRLVTSFRLHLYRHLQRLSMSFYHEHRSGEIATRLTADVDGGVSGMVGFLTLASWSVAVVAMSLASMLALSWKMTLVFVLLNAAYYGAWRVFSARIKQRARAVRDQAGEVSAFATEGVSAAVVMKSFAREDLFYGRFSVVQDRLYRAQVDAARINHVFGDLLQVLGKFLAPLAILGAGAWLVDREGLTIGALVAFWSFWGLVQSPLGILYGSGPAVANCMASMDRIQDFLEREPAPADKPGARHAPPSLGAIEFRGVGFAYPGRPDRPVFRDLSFAVPARTSLGVVGPSGAGKSTIVQLLLRFYDPQRGAVLVDGQDLRDLTQESLRLGIGVVLQESLLLSGTIRDNVRLGDARADDARVWETLAQAGAADFVSGLPGGLDATVGERGVSLSGGQRQRLCIARVFLRDPALVIFDEATSALDSATEALIQGSMQRLLKDRTAVIIAHRLSTVLSCDRILMLKDGQVLGLAPHAELLESCPEYAELVAGQDLRRDDDPADTTRTT